MYNFIQKPLAILCDHFDVVPEIPNDVGRTVYISDLYKFIKKKIYCLEVFNKLLCTKFLGTFKNQSQQLCHYAVGTSDKF